MGVTDDAEFVAPYQKRFLAMVDAEFRRWGVAEGVPRALRAAVSAVPRHRFVHRFREGRPSALGGAEVGPLRDAEAEGSAVLDLIYSDAVMRHVDAAGRPLPSSNSQPSYVLYLLHLLDLRPGQRVLEIGSGSGWLAAVMAGVVGEAGRVMGVELLAGLAAQSREDLAGVGLGRVAVRTGDGTLGDPKGAPFDRVMITAGVWSLPPMLFAQLAEGGLVLAPIELRGGGCQVTVLRREGRRLVSVRAVPGFFVPLLGEGQAREAVAAMPAGAATRRVRLPLGGGADAAGVVAFRAFLGRTEPGFCVFEGGGGVAPFGLAGADGSAALWRDGALHGFGGEAAIRRMARAAARWMAAGLPGIADFSLSVVPEGEAPDAAEGVWIERRGATVLVWRLAEGAEDWRGLAEG